MKHWKAEVDRWYVHWSPLWMNIEQEAPSSMDRTQRNENAVVAIHLFIWIVPLRSQLKHIARQANTSCITIFIQRYYYVYWNIHLSHSFALFGLSGIPTHYLQLNSITIHIRRIGLTARWKPESKVFSFYFLFTIWLLYGRGKARVDRCFVCGSYFSHQFRIDSFWQQFSISCHIIRWHVACLWFDSRSRKFNSIE